MTWQGLPTAIEWGGIDFVTMEPAPMMEPVPMVTPGRILTSPPSQQSFSMVMGRARSMP